MVPDLFEAIHAVGVPEASYDARTRYGRLLKQ
jgi:hypothetical protein